jgi:hypothetical protein
MVADDLSLITACKAMTPADEPPEPPTLGVLNALLSSAAPPLPRWQPTTVFGFD